MAKFRVGQLFRAVRLVVSVELNGSVGEVIELPGSDPTFPSFYTVAWQAGKETLILEKNMEPLNDPGSRTAADDSELIFNSSKKICQS